MTWFRGLFVGSMLRRSTNSIVIKSCADGTYSASSLAAAARLPTMHGRREYIEAGGMERTSRASSGARETMLTRFCAGPDQVICRLVISLITAQALGLDVPPQLLARAGEVIE